MSAETQQARTIFELGVTGLRAFGGYVREEFIKDLVGKRGVRTFREMSETDAIVGALLGTIEWVGRQVDWTIPHY